MIRKTLLTLTAVLVSVLALTAPASAAGPMVRTFNAYDLTQCSCTYNSTRTVAYVQSWPKVIVSSYYDTNINASTSVYTRLDSVNLYRAYNGAGSLSGNEIWTTNAEVGYVMCWTDSATGAQMDKVAMKLTVNDTFAWFIVGLPDQYVPQYVRDPNHHC